MAFSKKNTAVPNYSKINDPLSSAQVEQFRSCGFVVLDLGLNEDQLQSIIDTVEPLYPEDRLQNPTAPARVQDAWKQVEEVRELAISPTVLGALEQLFGRAALPFQTLNFPIGTRQRTHSDTVHFDSRPSGFMAGVWVALENIDLDNGPLQYYPGSQTLPVYTMQDFGLEPGYENYPVYETHIHELVEAEGLAPEYGCIERGQALIWHSNLLHGGAAQRDLSRSRHSQVTHYYFEGCEYFTPLLSTPDGAAGRKPFWIPAHADFTLPEAHPVNKFKSRLRRLAKRVGLG
jgi:hypothetical protein